MNRIGLALSVAILLTLFGFKPSLAAPTFTTLHVFDGTDGGSPVGSLIQGADGNLYGATARIGSEDGSIFTIDSSGNNFGSIFTFDGADGDHPFGGVIQGSDGFLYGTTASGGANNEGIIYKVATDGSGFTDLYDFGSSATDGELPEAPLFQGSDGAFYGTTSAGGANGLGTVFRFIPGSGLTILHSFGQIDINTPAASLVEGPDGSLYGTTNSGWGGWYGGIYRINLDGSGFTELHIFTGYPEDGEGGTSSLVANSDGFLYGTTPDGGTTPGGGTVFKIAPDGTGYQILHTFSGASDGDDPGPIILANDGNLYGAAAIAGRRVWPGGDFSNAPQWQSFQCTLQRRWRRARLYCQRLGAGDERSLLQHHAQRGREWRWDCFQSR